VITVHSVVRIKYVDTGEEHTFTLVLPGDKVETNRVSILAPTGIALLGYREKDLVEWQVPAGKRRVQIMKVVYQPENPGDSSA
jgi:regulator of nucleoside diphosphate kinase